MFLDRGIVPPFFEEGRGKNMTDREKKERCFSEERNPGKEEEQKPSYWNPYKHMSSSPNLIEDELDSFWFNFLGIKRERIKGIDYIRLSPSNLGSSR